MFCAGCSTHRICFRYRATEHALGSDEDEPGGAVDVYGSPQRVCDHCFYCSILAPLVEWAYDRPVDGLALRCEELELAIERLSAVTTSDTADWICRPLEGGDAEAAALDVESSLGTPLPPLSTLMQWAKVLLELDKGLAALRAQAQADHGLPEQLFWVRYFASVYDELNWDDGDDEYEYEYAEGEEEVEGYEYEEEYGEDCEEQRERAAAAPSSAPPQLPPQRPEQPAPQQQLQPVSIASFPLKQAMRDRDTARITELVHDSRTANSLLDVPKRFTALHVAVLQDHVRVVEHLLKLGARPDPLSVHGVTPLFAAVAKGNLCTVQRLVAAGANVNLPAGNGCVCCTRAVPRHAY